MMCSLVAILQYLRGTTVSLGEPVNLNLEPEVKYCGWRLHSRNIGTELKEPIFVTGVFVWDSNKREEHVR